MAGLISLFPTLIYKDLPLVQNFDLVNDEVEECYRKIVDNDEYDNVSWIHEKGNEIRRAKESTEHSYLISDDLIGNYNLLNLKERILNAVERYVHASMWSRVHGGRLTEKTSGYNIHIKSSWLNIQTNKNHDWHCHPGYEIAGVYYHEVDPDKGGIQFQNPNIMMQSCWFPEGNRTPQSIELIPQKGDIILFPAWLMHNTVENNTDSPRISIAFNVDLELLLDKKS